MSEVTTFNCHFCFFFYEVLLYELWEDFFSNKAESNSELSIQLLSCVCPLIFPDWMLGFDTEPIESETEIYTFVTKYQSSWACLSPVSLKFQ